MSIGCQSLEDNSLDIVTGRTWKIELANCWCEVVDVDVKSRCATSAEQRSGHGEKQAVIMKARVGCRTGISGLRIVWISQLRQFECLSPWNFFFLWRCGPKPAMAPTFLRFLDHTRLRTTVGSTPLDELSSCRRDYYVTTHNTHNRRRDSNPQSQKASGCRPTPRGPWDRPHGNIRPHILIIPLRNICRLS